MRHKLWTATALTRPVSCLRRYINPRNTAFALTSLVTLLLATVKPAQAIQGLWGFSNVTINNIPLDTNGNGLTNPTITSPDGVFNIQLQAYNSPNTPTPPDPSQIVDIFTGNFFRASDSTLPSPDDFAIFYNGQGTVNNREVLNYTFALSNPGVFDGSLLANFPNSGGTNYDFPSGDGTFDTKTRGFNFTLVVPSSSTTPLIQSLTLDDSQLLSKGKLGQLLAFGTLAPIPDRSTTTWSLLLVGAWGAGYKLKKQQARKNSKSN